MVGGCIEIIQTPIIYRCLIFKFALGHMAFTIPALAIEPSIYLGTIDAIIAALINAPTTDA